MKKLLCLPLLALFLLLPFPAAQAEDMAGARMEEARHAALTALDQHIEESADRYCVYYTADEYRLLLQEYNGSFGGVGVSMIQDEEKYIAIYKVLDTGPAKDSPIRAGDRILAVDGESVVGLDTDQAALRIRGDIGTPVTLTMLDAAGEQYELTLVRQEITNRSVEGDRIEESPNTAYIQISGFTGQTVREFGDEYNRLRAEGPVDWLILDLRSNTGGNFYSAISLAEFFVPAQQTVVREKVPEGATSYTSTSGMLRDTKLIVLQNEWTASASEVLAGALRDGAGATLIGSTSYGKGITQVIEALPSGGAWKYTHSRYYTPSGFDLHQVGLTPDIEVVPPEDLTSEDYFSTDPARDPHLRAALEYIGAAGQTGNQ